MAFDLSDIDGSNGIKLNGFLQNGQLGYSVSGLGDVNGDGIDDFILGAPYVFEQTNLETVLAGRSFVVFGTTGGFDADFELSMLDGSNGFSISRNNNARSGWSVAGAGDFNGDGIDDIMVGSPSSNSLTLGKLQAGQTHIIYGSTTPFAADIMLKDLTPDQGYVISGRKAGDRSGHSVASAGDFNGDGLDDVIIGAPFDEILTNTGPFVNSTGGAYVVYGTSSPAEAHLDISDLRGSTGLQLFGTTSSETAGRSVASAGDINGDGFDDIFLGTRLGLNDGRAHIVFGAAFGLHDQMMLSELDGIVGFSISGVMSGDDIGASAASPGDLNGDGIDDLIIAAPNKENSNNDNLGPGSVYVLYGSTTGFGVEFDLASLNGTNGFRIIGESDLDRTGVSVSGAGDVNGDGFADILIGAEDADRVGFEGADVGAAYVLFGSSSGFSATVELSELTPQTGLKIIGEHTYAQGLGRSVSAAGDVNNDGFADILIGAPDSDGDLPRQGATFVIYGGLNFGYLGSNQQPPVSGGAPDFGNDGFDDIMFFNPLTREVGQIAMPSTTWSGIGMAGTGWEARGNGRFDGDDLSPDILWYNASTGNVGRFDMVAGVLDSWQGIGRAGSGWSLADVGDFDGDGIDDILWHNAAENMSGQFRMTVAGTANWIAISGTGAGWEVAGTGDFNGDTIDDVLWFNQSSNSIGQFRMSATGKTWINVVTLNSNYEVAATGDFDGDGVDDILVFNDTSNELGYFKMSANAADWFYLGSAGSGWTIAGTGDFDGDGEDEILWQHNDGRIGQYSVNGSEFSWEFIEDSGPGWNILL